MDQAVQQPQQSETEEQPEQREGRLRDNILGGLRLSWEASPREFVTLVVLAVVSARAAAAHGLARRPTRGPGRAGVHARRSLELRAADRRARCRDGPRERPRVDSAYQRQDLFTWKVELQATKRFLEQAAARRRRPLRRLRLARPYGAGEAGRELASLPADVER